MTKSEYKSNNSSCLTYEELEIGQLAVITGPHISYNGFIVVKVYGGNVIMIGSLKETNYQPFNTTWDGVLKDFRFRLLGPEESVTLSND